MMWLWILIALLVIFGGLVTVALVMRPRPQAADTRPGRPAGRFKHGWMITAGVLCAALAMFSKEHGVITGVVILLDKWLHSSDDHPYPRGFWVALGLVTLGFAAAFTISPFGASQRMRAVPCGAVPAGRTGGR